MTPERYATLSTALARRQPDLTVLADNVHKPHNVAALMRSCDAVGVFEIHAVVGAATSKRAVGISGGTAPWVKVRRYTAIREAAAELKANNYQIVAAHFSDTAVDYRLPDYTRPTALLLGAELYGVSDEAVALADLHAVLPMRGLVASLNVSVAAALFLYEAARQREAAGMYTTCRLPPALYADTLFEWCYPEIAALCRAKSVAYPPLSSEGELGANPFIGSGTGAGRAP